MTVNFSEPVDRVDAADLLLNGVPATGLSGVNATYTFTFPQPLEGDVAVTWAPGHGIVDRETRPQAFDGTKAGETTRYTLTDTVPPVAVTISPAPGTLVPALTRVEVTFSEPVGGLEAAALFINGLPATKVSGSLAGPYVFEFPQPADGTVQVSWAPFNNIHDVALARNPFSGAPWTYTLNSQAQILGSVVFNEIMFQPYSGDDAGEWIELYNTTGAPINLAGWRLSKGVKFTFPEYVLPAHGYLVVCANAPAFQAEHPDVANVVGGWVGRLSNIDDDLELQDANGTLVNQVHYADSGDWATRAAGDGDARVFALTSSGTTARAVVLGFYQAGDRVTISGADQPEYNGTFTITAASGLSGPPATWFTYTMSGTPSAPIATGHLMARLLTDLTVQGWGWSNPANGFGRSLELCNPGLSNNNGQNWKPSVGDGGSPGLPNSGFTNNVPPLIAEVTHFPPVPKPSDTVFVTARLLDEAPNGLSAALYYRDASTTSPGAFLPVVMADDGLHGDGLANDGVFGASVPAQPNGTIIEFYVEATDTQGLSRTWPAPALMADGSTAQAANAVYQVDDNLAAASPNNASQPFYRIIMTETERARLANMSRSCNAVMNAGFITYENGQWQIRYNVGVRYRGAGTRNCTPTNYRVEIPSDRRWKGVRELNLNSQYVHSQLTGSAVAARAGLPAAQLRIVQMRINGQNLVPPGLPSNGSGCGGAAFGSYVYQEALNGDWAQRCLPENAGGNVYRGSKYPWNANLDYLLGNTLVTETGLDFTTYVNAGYTKASNHGENDWTDVFRLTWALNEVLSESDYLEAIRTNVNVELFMRYYAIGSLLDYCETAMITGVGDDYAFYRGNADPRFMLLPHDFDTILGQGDAGAGSTTAPRGFNINKTIWIAVDYPPSTASSDQANFLQRFMRHPRFVPVYFKELKRLCDTVARPEEFNGMLNELLGGWVDSGLISNMKNFMAGRRASIYAQLPLTDSVHVPLSQLGSYYHCTNPVVRLDGQANAIEVATVTVNGLSSTYSVWQGRWTNTVSLLPGINRVTVRFLSAAGQEFDRRALDIWYDAGAGSGTAVAGGTLSASATWPAASGPYRVASSLTIAAGVTLTLQPGTTVYLGSNANLTVASGGALVAAGTETAPILLTVDPATGGSWGGLTINGGAATPETRLVHARLDSNGTTAIHSVGGTLFMDHVTFGTTTNEYLSLVGSSFVVQDCEFPTPTGSFEPVHGSSGIKAGGRGLFLRNFFGAPNGYNDVIDFTDGNRPGQAIVQFIDNVFTGASDDVLDLDNTDAWVEGNIFLHVHKNGSPDTSSAVSGGSDTGEPSNVTIIGNLMYDCDHAAMAKQGNFFTLINNTIVHINYQGGQDTVAAVVCLQDNDMAEGAGMYLEGNIIQDVEQLTQNVTNALVTFTNNLMSLPWSGPGGNNPIGDPLFNHLPSLAETTNFTNWAQAQVLRQWFGLQTGSPAIAAGPNGQDKGGIIPLGASIAGEPAGTTRGTGAVLQVGVNRTGHGILPSGWPDGSGFTHYKWRLDGGGWSAETPLATPITLSGLANGPHQVEVAGKNDAGLYQDDPVMGPDAAATKSRIWIVNTNAPMLRLNEILADNQAAVPVNGKYPDLIELYNAGTAAADLSGVSLTDSAADPQKFVFPPGTTLGAGQYLVLYADSEVTPLGHRIVHLENGCGRWRTPAKSGSGQS